MTGMEVKKIYVITEEDLKLINTSIENPCWTCSFSKHSCTGCDKQKNWYDNVYLELTRRDLFKLFSSLYDIRHTKKTIDLLINKVNRDSEKFSTYGLQLNSDGNLEKIDESDDVSIDDLYYLQFAGKVNETIKTAEPPTLDKDEYKKFLLSLKKLIDEKLNELNKEV